MTTFTQSMVDRMWAEGEWDPDAVAWDDCEPEPPLTRAELAWIEGHERQDRQADRGMYDQ